MKSTIMPMKVYLDTDTGIWQAYVHLRGHRHCKGFATKDEALSAEAGLIEREKSCKKCLAHIEGERAYVKNLSPAQARALERDPNLDVWDLNKIVGEEI